MALYDASDKITVLSFPLPFVIIEHSIYYGACISDGAIFDDSLIMIFVYMVRFYMRWKPKSDPNHHTSGIQAWNIYSGAI